LTHKCQKNWFGRVTILAEEVLTEHPLILTIDQILLLDIFIFYMVGSFTKKELTEPKDIELANYILLQFLDVFQKKN